MLQKYLSEFKGLKVNQSSGYNKPHKACMLMAVIDLAASGLLDKNQIRFDQSLKDAFSKRFEAYRKGNDKDSPENPYFFLASSNFWQLVAKPGQEAELLERRRNSSISANIIHKIVEYARLSDDLFQLLKDPNARAVLSGALEGTLLSPQEAFEDWCRSIGKSEKTIANYVNAINGPINQWASDQQGSSIEIFTQTKPSQLTHIRDQLAQYSLYQERNQKGNGMYRAALNLWERYLNESQITEVVEHDIQLIQQRTLDSTVKDTLIRARRGQGLFRNQLLQYWENRCAVTGFSDTRFLIASHIKPWHAADDQERLDRFNGLPLIPSIDKAFDLGFISFKSNGKIMISPELEEPEKLGIRESQEVRLNARHQSYIEFHREHCFVH